MCWDQVSAIANPWSLLCYLPCFQQREDGGCVATGLHATLNKETQTPQFISGTDSGIKLSKNRRACVQYERSGSVVWMEWCQPSISHFMREGTITWVLLVWISIHLIIQLVGFFSCRVRGSWLVEYRSWWCMNSDVKWIDCSLLVHFAWTWGMGEAIRKVIGGLSINTLIASLSFYL